MRRLEDPVAPGRGGSVLRSGQWRAAAGPWAVSRVLVAVTLGIAKLIQHTRTLSPAAQRHMALLLLNWDAERYMQIAHSGYRPLPRIQLRFFPLVPLLARAGDRVLPGGAGAALVVEANLFALVFGVLVYRLVLHEKGSVELARLATWLVYLTPAAFVLAWGYTEPLWGCLTVGMLLALRRRQWWWAAACGVLAGLTRPVAPLLCLPALIEAGREVWERRGLSGLSGLSWRELVAGVGVFLAWVGWEFGDFKLPYTIQQGKHFRGSLTDPVRPLIHTAVQVASRHWLVYGLRVAWAAVLVTLVVFAFRRWPLSFGAYAAAALLVALCTQRLGSFERYGFSAFPVVLALAVYARERRAELPVLLVGAASLVLYGTMGLLGTYVP
jgi:hypothetical protein